VLLCKHCQKKCKNENSLRNHERLCRENPNRVIKPKSQKWLDAQKTKRKCNQWSNADYEISEETRIKLSESSKKQKWNEDRRLKHSEAMKLAVENNPGSYTSSNRGRTKQIIYDGLKFQGKWELEFYKYCKANNIEIVRCNEWFEYEWKGTRKYFPDFFLKEKNIYVEIKGYETERDRAKWSSFPKKLVIIKKIDIDNIRKGCFGGL